MNSMLIPAPPVIATALRSTLPFSFGHEFEPDFRAIVECADDSVIVTDTDLDAPGPTIRYVNPAFTRMTGYSAAEAVGRSPRFLQGADSNHDVLRGITTALRQGRIGQGKVINYTRDGTPYWIDLKIAPLMGADGRVRQFVAFQRDCTADMARFHEMRDLAQRDALTGVANRRAFLDELERHLAGPARAHLAFAFLDIDHFKQINDSHGHSAGDAVLMGLAQVLGTNTRRADLIGRLGGEEFGICMPNIRLAEARVLASGLRAGVAALPVMTPVGAVSATCSIGMTMAAPGDSTADLLARADVALYRAKRQGRNRLCVG